jgi:hypothetical protein
MGADLSGSGKWTSSGLGPDDKIYGIPREATDILIIPFSPLPSGVKVRGGVKFR